LAGTRIVAERPGNASLAGTMAALLRNSMPRIYARTRAIS
jgi:hypothetical protein